MPADNMQQIAQAVFELEPDLTGEAVEGPPPGFQLRIPHHQVDVVEREAGAESSPHPTVAEIDEIGGQGGQDEDQRKKPARAR